jgi:hypothetical protein
VARRSPRARLAAHAAAAVVADGGVAHAARGAAEAVDRSCGGARAQQQRRHVLPRRAQPAGWALAWVGAVVQAGAAVAVAPVGVGHVASRPVAPPAQRSQARGHVPGVSRHKQRVPRALAGEPKRALGCHESFGLPRPPPAVLQRGGGVEFFRFHRLPLRLLPLRPHERHLPGSLV